MSPATKRPSREDAFEHGSVSAGRRSQKRSGAAIIVVFWYKEREREREYDLPSFTEGNSFLVWWVRTLKMTPTKKGFWFFFILRHVARVLWGPYPFG